MPSTVQAKECLLVEVLGERVVAETADEEAVHAARVALEELSESCLVPCLIGRHEDLVAGGLAHATTYSGTTPVAPDRNTAQSEAGRCPGPRRLLLVAPSLLAPRP